MRIRPARDEDVAALTVIQNDAIANTAAIWDNDPVDESERQTWLENHRAAGHPVLVAVGAEQDPDAVVGYAAYGPYRPRIGYAATMENSVYVAPGQQGRGVGGALMVELLKVADGDPAVHTMIAAIESANTGSIRLHERFGFVVVGQMAQVGRKFDRWLDLTVMQRMCT